MESWMAVSSVEGQKEIEKGADGKGNNFKSHGHGRPH